MSLKKDPVDEADFWFDWGSDAIDPLDRFLPAGEVIAGAVVSVPVGLTYVEDDFTSKVVRVRISGGDVGEKFVLGCTITTSNGEVFKQEQKLEIKERISS